MHILILGTRGVPSQHGGFETFAQDIALYLTARNHRVTVYCQCDRNTPAHEDMWKGVRRVFFPAGDGAVGTVRFDLAAVRHAAREKGVVLTLGYNTGVFNYLLRWRKLPTVMNMDGIEWKRAKWSPMHRAWLWFNEIAGAHASDHLVADHPEISTHLQRHSQPAKITVIPYGARALQSASIDPVVRLGLQPKDYFLVVARAEPDNSILDIVQAYSVRLRKTPLVILGKYSPDNSAYHRKVLQAASPGVKFLGAIYDREIVQSLRFHAKAYVHGHRVGGTNPSLVESLAASNAIIAHNNQFTRWVAGEKAQHFDDSESLAQIFDSVEADPTLLPAMELGSKIRHEESFEMDRVLAAYETLLLRINERAVMADAPATFSVSGINGVGILDANHWVYRKAAEASPFASARHSRAATRYKLQLPIRYYWTDRGVEYSETGHTSNISANGVLIVGTKLPPLHCELRIEVLSSAAQENSKQVRTEFAGKVARIVEREGNPGFGVHGIFDYKQLTEKVPA